MPLQKLPLVEEMGELLVQQVFHLNGIPRDVVSDRGPQFTLQVSQIFCTALWAMVSLSSGYHPQFNGLTERANQSLESTLRSRSLAAWTSWLEHAYNSQVCCFFQELAVPSWVVSFLPFFRWHQGL